MFIHIYLQEPVGRVVGTRMVQKGGTMKEEKDMCYDIPIIESLQNLMNMEVVRDQVGCIISKLTLIMWKQYTN